MLIVAVFSCIVTMTGENRALLIGIGEYDTGKTGWRKIHGDNDVSLLVPMFKKHSFIVNTLTNREATKKNITKALKHLAAGCKAGDKVYFHFSGHGQPVIDCNGDEQRAYDEAVVPYDAFRSEGYSTGSKRYGGENHLIDDELAPFFHYIRKKIGKNGQLFIVFDACYSRGLEKGDNDFPEGFDVDDLPEYMRGSADYFTPTDKTYLKSLKLPERYDSGCTMAVVSACGENERNFEHKVAGQYYGSLSYCIYRLLRKNADFTSWIEYFRKKRYIGSGCFLSIQHPAITVY